MKDWKLGKLHNEWNNLLLDNDILNIKAPRSHLKTFFFFESYALQLCKFYPGIHIKYITSNDTLAIEKLSHIRRYLELPYFRDLLINADVNSKTQLVLSGGQKIDASGFSGKIRGGHPDIIILDDIIDMQVIYSDELNRKTKERLAMEVLPMAEPHTKIILIGTIQRDDDLYSVDLSNVMEGKKYVSKSYDAIVDEENKITLFPEKWNWNELMAKKREVTEFAGEKFFNKEYRNMATNLLGEIIKPDWYKEYDTLPETYDIYTGWDLSVGKDVDTGDWTAKVSIAIDKEENIYILDVYKERIDFSKRIRQIINQADNEIQRPVRIAIENNVFQADTVQVAKQNSTHNIIGVKTTINKVQKYNEQLVPLFENGRVFFKKGDLRQKDFWRELCSLPRGSHDDMSDALCIAIKDVLTTARPGVIFI